MIASTDVIIRMTDDSISLTGWGWWALTLIIIAVSWRS